jgi:hypothetical protein
MRIIEALMHLCLWGLTRNCLFLMVFGFCNGCLIVESRRGKILDSAFEDLRGKIPILELLTLIINNSFIFFLFTIQFLAHILQLFLNKIFIVNFVLEILQHLHLFFYCCLLFDTFKSKLITQVLLGKVHFLFNIHNFFS